MTWLERQNYENDETLNYTNPDHESKIKEETKEVVYRTTDLWLNAFRLTHTDIFDKVWGLNIKKHYFLADEIVKNSEVSIDEIKWLISDKNVDSNIRMELVRASYQSKIFMIDEELLSSMKSPLVSIFKWKDWVTTVSIKESISLFKLVLFRDWTLYKWHILHKENDPENADDNKVELIYTLDYGKVRSSWKDVK